MGTDAIRGEGGRVEERGGASTAGVGRCNTTGDAMNVFGATTTEGT